MSRCQLAEAAAAFMLLSSLWVTRSNWQRRKLKIYGHVNSSVVMLQIYDL